MAAFMDLLNSPPLTISEFHIAMIYVAMGNKEEAFNWLEKGYTQRDIWMKELKAWPWFDSLKDEPRYRNLLKRMNFPE